MLQQKSRSTTHFRAIRSGTPVSYVVAGAALIGAVLIRYLLDPWMGDTLPLVTLFGAVAAAVWVGGYRPAIVVTILGYVACSYLFIEPRGTLGFACRRRSSVWSPTSSPAR